VIIFLSFIALSVNSLARDVRIGGKANFIACLKTAQLALKNRQNKNQRQRVILFVGSPLDCDVGELVKLGKLLKKNNVAVDVRRMHKLHAAMS
jgi:26S proteasome regulatory subunit N10